MPDINNYFDNKEQENISYPEWGYDGNFRVEDVSFWHKHRINCIKSLLLKYIKDEIFFDIGGSNGYNCKTLQDSGIETVLIEPGIKACQNAMQRGVKNIICSSAENAKIKENSVSFMGLFDVLEHIEKDVDFLKFLNTKLTDKGLVFMTVPAYSFLWSKCDETAGHFRRYSLKEINKKHYIKIN